MQDFRKLRVWQKAHQLSLDIYKATKRFPKDEIYGLTSQIRRATVSIGANIAEGSCIVNSNAEIQRFLGMSLRSCDEVKLWLNFCRDLGYIEAERCEAYKSEYKEYGAMLYALWKRHSRS